MLFSDLSFGVSLMGFDVRSQRAAAHGWCRSPRRCSYIPVPISPTRREILAASAGWVAVCLNVVPGLGAGYLYQRPWKAYWMTSALATTWFGFGAVLGHGSEDAAVIQNQLTGLLGLVALAAGTAVEAELAAKKSREEG